MVLTLVVPVQVAAVDVVHRFEVNAVLTGDGRSVFGESIRYDMGDQLGHGILRRIPVDYRRTGARYDLDLRVSDVRRNDVAEPYDVSRKGGDMVVRIGHADRYIKGLQTYDIQYRTSRAVNFFKDRDEMYWNVTGNGWEVPIEQASFFLTLPTGIAAESVSTTCFTGVIGSTEQACTSSLVDGVAEFRATRVLLPGENLTIVVGLPKGVLHEPTVLGRFVMLVQENRSLFVPVIALVFMYALWRYRGKDPDAHTVIAQYGPPDELPPAVVQAIDSYGQPGNRGVTATILELSKKGYLHILFEDDGKTFSFKRVKGSDARLSDIEKTLLDGMFQGQGPGKDVRTMSDLRLQGFHAIVADFRRSVADGLDEMQVFDDRPATVRGRYVLLSIVTTVALIVLFGGVLAVDIFSAVATGCVIAVFGWHMPRPSVAGARLAERIEGFKLFLSVTEKDRVAFHDAPEKRPQQFTEFLPYAIALGIEDKWAAQFAGMDMVAPEWAEGVAPHMNAVTFSHAMRDMHLAAGAYAYQAPMERGSSQSSWGAGGGSSGFSGGSSGGGFGGGGGGRW